MRFLSQPAKASALSEERKLHRLWQADRDGGRQDREGSRGVAYVVAVQLHRETLGKDVHFLHAPVQDTVLLRMRRDECPGNVCGDLGEAGAFVQAEVECSVIGVG